MNLYLMIPTKCCCFNLIELSFAPADLKRNQKLKGNINLIHADLAEFTNGEDHHLGRKHLEERVQWE